MSKYVRKVTDTGTVQYVFYDKFLSMMAIFCLWFGLVAVYVIIVVAFYECCNLNLMSMTCTLGALVICKNYKFIVVSEMYYNTGYNKRFIIIIMHIVVFFFFL